MEDEQNTRHDLRDAIGEVLRTLHDPGKKEKRSNYQTNWEGDIGRICGKEDVVVRGALHWQGDLADSWCIWECLNEDGCDGSRAFLKAEQGFQHSFWRDGCCLKAWECADGADVDIL